MDWNAFFKDNSQAMFTLIGVFLGSGITFLGNYLNNRFQAKENDKGREEKRREVRRQLAIELMKNDIKRIEDVNNLVFEFLNKVRTLNLKRDIGKLTSEEWRTELISLSTGEKGIFAKVDELDTTTDVLVFLFGDEIYSAYKNCQQVLDEYFAILANPSSSTDDQGNAYEKLIAAFGKYQRMIRERLISSGEHAL